MKIFTSLFALLMLCVYSGNAQTQNLALLATANHSGGGQTAFNYGPDEYNDNDLSPQCNQLPWGWVSTNGWIEFEWTTPQNVGKVVFYKSDRPMTSCVVQYWDGSGYVNIMNYSGTSCDDSVTFNSVLTTKIRLNNVSGSSNPNHREIRIFSTAVPCDDTITSSVVKGPNVICPNKPFKLNIALNSGMLIAGMTYQWQYSNNGTAWSNFTGVPSSAPGGDIVDSIMNDRWYRCVLTCTSNNKTYTTPPKKVSIAPFYYCYCDNKVTVDAGADIGNVKVISTASKDTIINTAKLSIGISAPVYSNNAANKSYTALHDSLAWPCMYRDSIYQFVVTQVHTGASLSSTVLQAYLDANRDGLYDPATERILVKAINGTSNPPHIAETSFKMPSNAEIGPTGLRIVISKDTVKLQPCDTLSGEGEVEDYIVRICHRPCDGPTNAGIVTSTDTSMCAGYEYTLTDTTFEKARSGFTRSWQISADNISWFNIQNSTNKDTLERVFTGQPLYYRLRVICPNTLDTTYSPETRVNVKPGYKCYCYSKAVGGLGVDTSDIGGVSMFGYSNNVGGPHLLNTKAVRPRTDFTDIKPIDIFTDSTYSFYIYHIMPVVEHGDAKVTIFMDFDNDHEYDIPSERVFTGFTSIGNHTLIEKITIPINAITDVPTGMRIVLNNDVGPNVPSDEACGPYQSGETEDYLVIFRKKWGVGIAEAGKLNGFGLYPNPTNGRFRLQFSTTGQIDQLQVRITNLTGQEVFTEQYHHSGGMFDKELELTGQPAGVYFVELNTGSEKLMRKLVVR